MPRPEPIADPHPDPAPPRAETTADPSRRSLAVGPDPDMHHEPLFSPSRPEPDAEPEPEPEPDPDGAAAVVDIDATLTGPNLARDVLLAAPPPAAPVAPETIDLTDSPVGTSPAPPPLPDMPALEGLPAHGALAGEGELETAEEDDDDEEDEDVEQEENEHDDADDEAEDGKEEEDDEEDGDEDEKVADVIDLEQSSGQDDEMPDDDDSSHDAEDEEEILDGNDESDPKTDDEDLAEHDSREQKPPVGSQRDEPSGVAAAGDQPLRHPEAREYPNVLTDRPATKAELADSRADPMAAVGQLPIPVIFDVDRDGAREHDEPLGKAAGVDEGAGMHMEETVVREDAKGDERALLIEGQPAEKVTAPDPISSSVPSESEERNETQAGKEDIINADKDEQMGDVPILESRPAEDADQLEASTKPEDDDPKSSPKGAAPTSGVKLDPGGAAELAADIEKEERALSPTETENVAKVSIAVPPLAGQPFENIPADTTETPVASDSKPAGETESDPGAAKLGATVEAKAAVTGEENLQAQHETVTVVATEITPVASHEPKPLEIGDEPVVHAEVGQEAVPDSKPREVVAAREDATAAGHHDVAATKADDASRTMEVEASGQPSILPLTEDVVMSVGKPADTADPMDPSTSQIVAEDSRPSKPIQCKEGADGAALHSTSELRTGGSKSDAMNVVERGTGSGCTPKLADTASAEGHLGSVMGRTSAPAIEMISEPKEVDKLVKEDERTSEMRKHLDAPGQTTELRTADVLNSQNFAQIVRNSEETKSPVQDSSAVNLLIPERLDAPGKPTEVQKANAENSQNIVEIGANAEETKIPAKGSGALTLSSPAFGVTSASSAATNIKAPMFGIGKPVQSKVVSFSSPPSFQRSALSPNAPSFVPLNASKTDSTPAALLDFKRKAVAPSVSDDVQGEKSALLLSDKDKGHVSDKGAALSITPVVGKSAEEKRVNVQPPRADRDGSHALQTKQKPIDSVQAPKAHIVATPSESAAFPIPQEQKKKAEVKAPLDRAGERCIREIGRVAVSVRARDGKVRKRENLSTIGLYTTESNGSILRFLEGKKSSQVVWSSLSSNDRIRIKKVTNRPFTMSVTKLGEARRGKPVELNKYFLHVPRDGFQAFFNSCIQYMHEKEVSPAVRKTETPQQHAMDIKSRLKPTVTPPEVKKPANLPKPATTIQKNSKMAAEKKLILEKLAALQKRKEAMSSKGVASASKVENAAKSAAKESTLRIPSAEGATKALPAAAPSGKARVSQTPAKNGAGGGSGIAPPWSSQRGKRPSSALDEHSDTQRAKKSKSGAGEIRPSVQTAVAGMSGKPKDASFARLTASVPYKKDIASAMKSNIEPEPKVPMEAELRVDRPGEIPSVPSGGKPGAPLKKAAKSTTARTPQKDDVSMKDSHPPVLSTSERRTERAPESQQMVASSALAAARKEAQDARREAQNSLKALQETRRRMEEAQRQTDEAQKEAQTAQKETQNAQKETQGAHTEADEARREAQEAQKKMQEALDRTLEADRQMQALRTETLRLQKELQEALNNARHNHTRVEELLSSISVAKSHMYAAPQTKIPSVMYRCIPSETEDFFARLRTFTPTKWSGFLELGTIDPVECAMHGWFITDVDRLQSTEGAEIELKLRACTNAQSYQDEVERVRALILGKGHKLLSGWVGQSCPEEFKTLEGSKKFYTPEQLRMNAESLKESQALRCLNENTMDVDLYLPLQFKGDNYMKMAVYNWTVKKANGKGLRLCCDWCNRCLAIGVNSVRKTGFHIRNSHYEFCALRRSDAGVVRNVAGMEMEE